MYKIISSSELKNFDTWSALFYCLFEEERNKVLNTPRDEIVEYINKQIVSFKILEFNFTKYTNYGTDYKNISNELKNSLSNNDLNKAISILSGEENIVDKSEKTLFNKIATFVLFIIKTFDPRSKVDIKIKELEEKLIFLKSLY